jgi:hypothetical protein
MELVRAMAPEQQTSVLSAPDAVWGLADNSHAGVVMELVRAMAPEQQTSVLSAPNAVLGLTESGQAGAVEAIRQSWIPQVPSGAGRSAASFPVKGL